MNTQGMTAPYYGAATGLTLGGAQPVGPLTQGQIGYYQNPFNQAVAAPTLAALQQQQGIERSTLLGKQASSGAFGGDRAGLTQANLARQQALGTAQAIAPIFQQGYQQAAQTALGQQGVIGQDLTRQLAAGAQLGNLGMGAQQAALQSAQAQLAAGTLPQQTQQADLTAQYQQFLQERGYPFQVSQFLANIAEGTGALSGSTTTTQAPTAFFSDEREKTNIKSLGDGLYAYDYKDDVKRARESGEPMPPKRVGPMAGNLEKVPGLVTKINGHKVVTPDGANSMGGGVFPSEQVEAYARGGYAGGSSVYGEPIDFGSILAANQAALAGITGQKQKAAGLAIPSEKGNTPRMLSPHSPPQKQQPAISAESAVSGAIKAYQLNKDPNFSPWKDFKEKIGLGDKTAGGTQVTNNAATNTSTATRAAPTAAPNVGVKTQQRADIPAANANTVSTKGIYPPGVTAEMIQQAKSQAPLDALRQEAAAFKGAGTPGEQNLGEAGKSLTDGMNEPIGEMSNLGFATADFGGADVPMETGSGEMFANGIGFRHGGLVPRQHYAGKGFVTPGYDEEVNPNDIMDKTVEEGQQDPSQLKNEQKGLEHQLPQQGKSGAGGLIGTILGAGLGSMFGMPGLGATLGGQAGNLFHSGGLVPREHHAGNDGNVVDPDRVAITDAIRQGAEAEGAPDLSDYLTKVAGAESTYNPRAVNPDTKATGLFQIKPDTFAWSGVEGDPTDPVVNARAAVKTTKWNREQLEKYGHEPTEGNTYLAHFLGHRGAKWALDNPDKPMAEVHPKWDDVVKVNSKIPGIADWTGKDAAAWADAKINGKTPPEVSRRPGVKQTDYSGSSPQFASLGDVARSVLPEAVPTSENFWVPTLSFLGGMLASPSPKLAGAIGSGLVSGVQGYAGLRQQQQEDIKNIMSIVDKQYKRTYNEDTGEFEFTDRFGAKVTPMEAQVGVARLMLGQGLDPRTYGIPAEAVAQAKAVMSGKAKPAQAGMQTIADKSKTIPEPIVKTPAKQQQEVAAGQAAAAQNVNEEDLLGMSRGELWQYVSSSPELKKRYGLEKDYDPQMIDSRMERERKAIDAYGSSGQPELQAAAKERLKLLQETKEKALDRATNLLSARAEKYQEASMKSLEDYDKKRAERSSSFASEKSRMVQLASILSQTETGDPKVVMSRLSQWLREAGVPELAISQAQSSSAGLDQITKLVNDRIYQTMTAQNLIRAPASVGMGLEKTQPGASAVPGATKPLVARILAEMDLARERDLVYGTGRDAKTGRAYYGSNPLRFEERYNSDPEMQKKLDTKIAEYLTNLPDPKGVTPQEKENWYKTWGQFGYDPTAAVQKRAGAAAPAAGTTSTNVPFKVVQ
jgi:hypothetical protein